MTNQTSKQDKERRPIVKKLRGYYGEELDSQWYEYHLLDLITWWMMQHKTFVVIVSSVVGVILANAIALVMRIVLGVS